MDEILRIYAGWRLSWPAQNIAGVVAQLRFGADRAELCT